MIQQQQKNVTVLFSNPLFRLFNKDREERENQKKIETKTSHRYRFLSKRQIPTFGQGTTFKKK